MELAFKMCQEQGHSPLTVGELEGSKSKELIQTAISTKREGSRTLVQKLCSRCNLCYWEWVE